MAESNGQGASSGTRSGVTVPHVNGKATYAEKYNLPAHFIGGNRLEKAPSSKVKDFVASHDGHTVITNVSLPQRASASGLCAKLPDVHRLHG